MNLNFEFLKIKTFKYIYIQALGPWKIIYSCMSLFKRCVWYHWARTFCSI